MIDANNEFYIIDYNETRRVNYCVLNRVISNNLRDRGHSFSSPEYNTNTEMKSFVVRILYKFI